MKSTARNALILAAIAAAEPAYAGARRIQMHGPCVVGNTYQIVAKLVVGETTVYDRVLAEAKCEQLPMCTSVTGAWPDSVLYGRTAGQADQAVESNGRRTCQEIEKQPDPEPEPEPEPETATG